MSWGNLQRRHPRKRTNAATGTRTRYDNRHMSGIPGRHPASQTVTGRPIEVTHKVKKKKQAGHVQWQQVWTGSVASEEG